MKRLTRTVAVGMLVLAATLQVPQAATASPAPSPTAEPAVRQAALADPDAILGTRWRQSTDVMVNGAGDAEGFHLFVARESESFAWSPLVPLNAGMTEVGTWTGNVCVTGSGRYAVATYAPAAAANRPALLSAGAFASGVEFSTGRPSRVGPHGRLAYFNTR